jgi:hypothetical protein
VRRDFTGHVSGQDLVTSLVELAGGAAFSELRYSLTIALDITGFDIDDRTVDDLAAQDFGAWFSNTRFVSAWVAVHPGVIAVFEHFVNLNVSQVPRRLFATEADALAWLAEIGRT